MEFDYEPGRFYKNDANGDLQAEVTFEVFNDEKSFAINHTYVNGNLRGQGIAAQLIKAVVDKARAEDKTILPLCTYAKAAFQKNPEYQDIEYRVRP
ncbi:hypothetical protein FC83_GL000412 [Agrilactobacillus composti DSM 18527 = JCM 14202]|jgi:predicted GNAT family acetyltransferase|uniref:N-acetyltransferase domain-containing protein n=1 Tax=Agrilactobacillus composti DSM 18527 = JCM 14202 TaxID=1423734 RepID=X0PEL0_9LACO|nr:GNAT family N-acetyltransferase [Agrilactobacillus composti]KRM32545.1 hypothetical protein FC83_GL000412 [Agrilactobacillus composti DSM 18527 = JCM 14202]MCH4172135.1 N-acetyltransferase [Lactobacillus sp.]GAF40149.1 hypothetical protein JCM14202_2037 [Agrilactobacillus composti DSM 18527 = JCM 14202]